MTQYEENFEYLINLAAIVLGVLNYSENLDQNDKQEIMKELGKSSDAILEKIDAHLKSQDEKLDKILGLLENKL